MRPETRNERRKWRKEAEEFTVEFSKRKHERKRRARWYIRHKKESKWETEDRSV